jgi:hypothetical protein
MLKRHDRKNATEELSRRDATANLLKAVGAAALVTSCAAEGEQVSVRQFAAEVTSGNLLVADFVTDLKTVTRGTRTVALVFGFSSVGDGGGGLFSWKSGTNPWPDDCIYITPTSDTSGYWQRVWAGELSVKWFGAKGDDTNDDAPAIQKGLDTLGFHRGGVLIFPRGIYKVVLGGTAPSALQIPRNGCGVSIPVTLRGEGTTTQAGDSSATGCTIIPPAVSPSAGMPNGTLIHFVPSGLMPATQAVLTWKAGGNAECVIEKMGFWREAASVTMGGPAVGGAILKHPGGISQRFLDSAIRDCYFVGGLGDGQDYALIDLEWAYRVTLDNVKFDGGENGLRFNRGGHIILRNCGTKNKMTASQLPFNKTGITINHAGPVIIQNARFEGATVAHIKVDSDAAPSGPLSIDGLTTEAVGVGTGGDEINLRNTVQVRIANIDIGFKLKIGDNCRDVQLANVGFTSGGLLEFGSNVKHVRGEGIIDNSAPGVDPAPRFTFGTANKDIKLLLHKVDNTTLETYPFPLAVGLESTGLIINSGDTLQIRGCDASSSSSFFPGSGGDFFSVTASPLRYIQNGHPNQVITLYMTGSLWGNGASPPVGGYSRIQLRGNVTGLVTVTAGTVIQLMYRSGAWYELGR